MSTVTATFVDVQRSRRWRAFDSQLLLYVVLLIGLGLVMGFSANYEAIGGAS